MQDTSNTFRLRAPLPSYHALRSERERLPVAQYKAAFTTSFIENDVLIVSSGTRSGKTAQLPQYAASLTIDRNTPGNIACTQARRLAATRVAERVAQEAGCELGAQVGYQIRGKDRTSAESRLVYLTDELPVAQACRDLLLAEYHTIVVDEAYECNTNMLLLLALL
ncbi:hypothetical protein ABW21_db0206375 [Orbilia brochopaga]|nr:hypothetical protein ABW21_db0206375 [Drechslerella brochopaga]